MKSCMEHVNAKLERFCMGKKKIAITLFDKYGNCVTHRGGGKSYCRFIRCDLGLCSACRECDKRAMEVSVGKNKRYEYLCHAGVTEVARVLRRKDGTVIGYLVVGKFRRISDEARSRRIFEEAIAGCDESQREQLTEYFEQLPVLDGREYRAVLRDLDRLAEALCKTDRIKGLYNREALFCTRLILESVEEALRRTEKEGEVYVERITCESLCERFYLSRHSTESHFRAECGETPARFIKERILVISEDLFMNTHYSTRMIAAMFGYGLPSFYAFFKRECGVTPGQFRAYRKDDKNEKYEWDGEESSLKCPFSVR